MKTIIVKRNTGKPDENQGVNSMTGLAEFFVRQGWEQGGKDKAIEIAKRMIRKHRCADDIMEFTDLGRDVLEGLAAEMGENLQEASQTSAPESQIETRG